MMYLRGASTPPRSPLTLTLSPTKPGARGPELKRALSYLVTVTSINSTGTRPMTERSVAPSRWRALSLAKRGNRADEIEDAWAASEITGRFAVADGVTDSIFSNVWARLLVDRFVAEPPSDAAPWTDWLAAPREAWQRAVHQRQLPWYSEHKLSTGAAATFVGLQIRPDGTWSAVAVGDACLFHLRDQRLLKAFPMEQSSAFNNRPFVICSNSQTDEAPVTRTAGQWQAGDVFALATDALAQWLLAEHERDVSAWNAIDQLMAVAGDSSRVESEVNALRDSRQLRNDDVTLLVVNV